MGRLRRPGVRKIALPPAHPVAYNRRRMHQERLAKLTEALRNIQQVLIARYQPERIYLFGSMASGPVLQWSDIDLVVVKETQLPFLARLKEIALLCKAPVGVDYLVYTPAEFEAMVAGKNPFIVHEVLGRGKLLYERQPAATVAG